MLKSSRDKYAKLSSEDPTRTFLLGYGEDRAVYGKYPNQGKIPLRENFSIKDTDKPLFNIHANKPQIQGPKDNTVSVRHPYFYVDNVVPPKPSLCDEELMKGGILYRVGRQRPKQCPRLINELYRFTCNHVRELIRDEKLDVNIEIPTVDAWLDTTTYSYKIKERMRKLANYINNWEDINLSDDFDPHEIRAFVKEEFYPEYKPDRSILPRQDLAKMVMGPVFHAIDKSMHIKQICKSDTPDELRRKFFKLYDSGFSGKVAVTDYTAWEASQTSELIKAVEWPLYKAMLGNQWEKFKHVANILTGQNRIVFRSFVAFIKGTRMSGEMNTSLGNTWMNYIIMRFMAFKNAINIKSFHVGDDGVVFLRQEDSLDLELFSKLGLEIKMNYVDEIWKADLCKLHYLPSGSVVRNPDEVLAKMGWFSRKFINARRSTLTDLLVSKAICYLFLLKDCPIITPLCISIVRHYGITMARFKRRFNNDAEYNYLRLTHSASDIYNCIKKLTFTAITYEARKQFDELFNISPDTQHRIENHDVLTPLENYGHMFPEEWKDNFKEFTYQSQVHRNTKTLKQRIKQDFRLDTRVAMPYTICSWIHKASTLVAILV